MPSSGVNVTEQDYKDADLVAQAIRDHQVEERWGMLGDFLAVYTASIREGNSAEQAAVHALIEWDL